MFDLLGLTWVINWHSGLLLAIAVAVLLQTLLTRTLPEGMRLLRNNFVFSILSGLLYLIGQLLPQLGVTSASTSIIIELSVLGWGLVLIRLVGLTIYRVILPALHLTPPRILEDIVIVAAYIAWGLIRLRYAGLNLSSLVATSAVITGIVAFSMQETLGNILGGLALQLDKSIIIGDWIKIDDVRGKIIEVQWRHTTVLTNNGEKVVIPNSVLMKSKVDVISSEELPLWRRWITFSLHYTTPPQRVISAIEKAISQADIPHVADTPSPQCIVMDYHDGSIFYAVRYWLQNPAYDDVTDSNVRVHIYVALQREGYELAKPCLDVDLVTESVEKNAQARELEIQHRLIALNKVRLFKHLTEEEMNTVASSLRNTPFTKGDVITHQGATAHWLYLISSGEADVWYENLNKERHHLSMLTAGDVVGEMGLMTGEPRSATVTAKTDVDCYRLDKKSFESILLERPELTNEFAHILSERNQQLMAAQENVRSAETQEASILENIRHFFGLSS
jgi:small-conductance mechanosensitive channel/CRP-like cAMP-binding protein